jgi:hypothetical protein
MIVLGHIPRKAAADGEKRVTTLLRGLAAGLVASVTLVLSTKLFAGGEWPDGPNKHWFQGLKRPDNAKHPYRDEKSLFCCHPEDRWYAWIKDEWLACSPR